MDHEELELLEQFNGETQTKFNNRLKFRELNSPDNIEYPDVSTLEKLESSIKKNSALVKRLKVFSESQKVQILDEIDKLNLTKFISEIAYSLIEAKLKLSDIPSVIEICTKLNQTYRDFSKHLLDQYTRYFPIIRRKFNNNSSNNDPYNSALVQANPFNQANGPSSLHGGLVSSCTNHLVKLSATRSSSDPLGHTSNSSNSGYINNSNSAINPSKIRVDLRLFAELIINGVLPLKDSFPILVNLLGYLMIYDKNAHQNANAILTFCKGCGDELLGLIPVRIEQLARKFEKQLPTSGLISAKRQSSLKAHVCEYYQVLLRHFHDSWQNLNQLIIKNKRNCSYKNELSKESKELVDVKHSELQKAQNVLNQLADILGESPPDLPNVENIDEGSTYDDFESSQALKANVNPNSTKGTSIWDDDGTRSFYEDLVDLTVLFANLPVRVAKLRRKNDVSTNDKNTEGHKKNDTNPNLIQSPTTSSPKPVGEEADELERADGSSSSDESLSNAKTLKNHPTAIVVAPSVLNKTQPEQYFAKLSNCVNRDMIDNAAIDFIRFFNTKFGRRKLVKTLFNVPRTRLDLLPFFARLTATIYPHVPSIGNELVNLFKLEFRNLFRKKDQINIESKVKNVRFIGELVKFNLFPEHEALNCLRMLLSDFTHHHIEMTCNLLETCGRLLYKSPVSHHQMRLILEQMMRKKLLLSVDSKYVTMIENAYYFTNPPEVMKHIVEEPSVHLYVRYLLCECLNRSTIDTVLKKIKLIDWTDKKLAKFAINCMIEAYNLKFYNIRYLAALLAALNKDHRWIATAVIDGVVEDILLMIEINEVQFNQRRIPMIRYFGELYTYRLSDSSLVFKILYSLITYGVYYPEPDQTLNQILMSKLDLPENLFRIKLVCDLLDTCGQYLNSGQEKKKLDCYLLFFQRYYWCKKHIYMLHPYCMAKSGNKFPPSTEYLYNDTIYNLRPSFSMAQSYLDAIQSLQDFIDKLKDEQPRASG